MGRALEHWSQPSCAVQQVTCMSHVLGLFVPMSVEVWEGGFQKRSRKHLLSVAQLLDVTQLGTESCFLPWLWSCSLTLYLGGALWWWLELSQPLEQPSVQSPEELGYSCVSGAGLGAKQGNNWGLEAAEVRGFHCCWYNPAGAPLCWHKAASLTPYIREKSLASHWSLFKSRKCCLFLSSSSLPQISVIP